MDASKTLQTDHFLNSFLAISTQFKNVLLKLMRKAMMSLHFRLKLSVSVVTMATKHTTDMVHQTIAGAEVWEDHGQMTFIRSQVRGNQN